MRLAPSSGHHFLVKLLNVHSSSPPRWADNLRLGVADNLTQVIAGHCKGITIAITELGATDLRVRHTLVVQMRHLRN